MILDIDKTFCSGCEACVQRCPNKSVVAHVDEHGFAYPYVITDMCIECHLCEKVCPINNQRDTRVPLSTYAAINIKDEIRLKSSSGGVFTAIAELVIQNGGVVFGARFNENGEVIHDYTEVKEGLDDFRRSKYVQSQIRDNFIKVEMFLKQGRQVMFTGTPCHIAGLKSFLRKDYDNLLLIDVACHGVPSQFVWKSYISKREVSSVNFRDKKTGWKKYSISINDYTSLYYKDMYMLCFLSNLSLRPSCFNCQFKSGSSGSDLTLGDFWGVDKYDSQLDDDLGTSLVLSFSRKGENLLRKTDLKIIDVDYKMVCSNNSALVYSAVKPKEYDIFWHDFSKSGIKAINKWGKRNGPSKLIMIKKFIHRLIYKN